jgi:hypothetical protein
LLYVSWGVTLILDNNITLQGNSNSNFALVGINSAGALIMNQGAKITGHASSGVSTVGTFTMNGGEISYNSGSGVGVGGGTFTKNGGTISGNTGSGVWTSSTFTMNGGEISGNTAYRGGGVYVIDINSSGYFGTFTKTGGIVYGSNGSNTDNTATGTDSYGHGGHAVYVNKGSDTAGYYRDTTAWSSVNLDSKVAGSAGGWNN